MRKYYYLPFEMDILDKEFVKYFGVSFKNFHDRVLSYSFGHAVIDVIKFDDWLREKFGEYENEGKSMKNIILEKFGKDALELIKNLTI